MKNTKNSLSEIYMNLSAKEYNNIVRNVNENTPREEVKKYYSKEKMKVFDELSAKLKEERKKNPKASYGPVESEW